MAETWPSLAPFSCSFPMVGKEGTAASGPQSLCLASEQIWQWPPCLSPSAALAHEALDLGFTLATNWQCASPFPALGGCVAGSRGCSPVCRGHAPIPTPSPFACTALGRLCIWHVQALPDLAALQGTGWEYKHCRQPWCQLGPSVATALLSCGQAGPRTQMAVLTCGASTGPPSHSPGQPHGMQSKGCVPGGERSGHSHVHTCTCTHRHEHLNAHMDTCMPGHMHAHAHTRMYPHMHALMCIRTCTHACTCAHV